MTLTNLVSDAKQEQAIKEEPAMEAQNVYYSSSRAKFNSYRGRGRGRAQGFGRSDKVVNWRSGQRDSNSQSSQRISRKKPIPYMLMVKFLGVILVDQFFIGHMHV